MDIASDDDPPERSRRALSRTAVLTLVLAAVLIVGGWITQLANMPAG